MKEKIINVAKDKYINVAKDKYTNSIISQSSHDRLFHTLIIGETGCGKPHSNMYPMIIQDLEASLNRECSMILLDPTSAVYSLIDDYTDSKSIPVIKFNPVLNDCPHYNPFIVNEDTCIKNISNMFNTLHPNCSKESKKANLKLIANSIKLVKRLYKDNAVLNILERFLNCSFEQFKFIINEFIKLNISDENKEIIYWFRDIYNTNRKDYEDFCTDISKLNNDKYLSKVLNPVKTNKTISFEEIVLNEISVIINTSYGILRDRGRILSVLIMSEIESAILKRKNHKNPIFLYLYEFQTCYNEDFMNLVLSGRLHNVGVILSLQSLNALDSCTTKFEKEKLISNVRNIILHPSPNCLTTNIEDFKILFGNKIFEFNNYKFNNYNLNHMQFPEFCCKLISNGDYTKPIICKPINYN